MGRCIKLPYFKQTLESKFCKLVGSMIKGSPSVDAAGRPVARGTGAIIGGRRCRGAASFFMVFLLQHDGTPAEGHLGPEQVWQARRAGRHTA